MMHKNYIVKNLRSQESQLQQELSHIQKLIHAEEMDFNKMLEDYNKSSSTREIEHDERKIMHDEKNIDYYESKVDHEEMKIQKEETEDKKHGRNLKSKHQSETEGKTESKTEGKIHLASEHKKIVEKHKAKGHELQSVIFKEGSGFDGSEQKKWLKKHGYKNADVDVKKNGSHRYRQHDPDQNKYNYRTITLSKEHGIKGIFEYPKSGK